MFLNGIKNKVNSKADYLKINEADYLTPFFSPSITPKIIICGQQTFCITKYFKGIDLAHLDCHRQVLIQASDIGAPGTHFLPWIHQFYIYTQNNSL